MQTPPESPSALALLERKAVLLLVAVALLVLGFLLYVMYARGVFESTQQLVLIADDSEGVSAGMDLTFSGFPVGRVQRIELAADGKVRIVIDVPRKDAHWLRTSSIFTMERGLVGDTRIRAFSGILTDPPLAANAERTVLRGDTGAEIPRLVASMRALLENLDNMTGPESSINASLGNLKIVSERLNGRYGLLGGVLGSDEQASKIMATLDKANAVMDRTNSLLAQTDHRVFGAKGVMDDTQAAVQQLTGALSDVRASLKKVDAVLAEAQAVGANARVASADLGALRAEVELSLRKISQLVDEVKRKWPFVQDTEIKLP